MARTKATHGGTSAEAHAVPDEPQPRTTGSRTTDRQEPSAAGTADLHGLRGGAARGRPRDLDRLIHERVRLGIVSALAVTDTLSFTELRDMLGTSDGNLSVHARKLEEGGYITCTKAFHDRVPKTQYRLTAEGRRALETYVAHMEALIHAIRRG